jgi:hypothetical protein
MVHDAQGESHLYQLITQVREPERNVVLQWWALSGMHHLRLQFVDLWSNVGFGWATWSLSAAA